MAPRPKISSSSPLNNDQSLRPHQHGIASKLRDHCVHILYKILARRGSFRSASHGENHHHRPIFALHCLKQFILPAKFSPWSAEFESEMLEVKWVSNKLIHVHHLYIVKNSRCFHGYSDRRKTYSFSSEKLSVILFEILAEYSVRLLRKPLTTCTQ